MRTNIEIDELMPEAQNSAVAARDSHSADCQLPVAIAYNLFLDRFISGITIGAMK